MNRIIIDIDNTLINTIATITNLYNDDFKWYSKFKPVDWHDVKTWDFEELELASREYINHYFNQPRFFREVVFMNNAVEVIERLSQRYEIVFCSMCYSPNGRAKDAFLKEVFPHAKFINVNIKDYPDKSHIDMTGAIFIDDDGKNLETSNASIKICFGDILPWNESYESDRCYSWLDVENYIRELEENKNILEELTKDENEY